MAINPENILSDSENYTTMNGVEVRKGSLAAFLKNIDMLEGSDSSTQDKEAALQAMKDLAHAVIVTGLYKHTEFKNAKVRDLLDREAKNLKA